MTSDPERAPDVQAGRSPGGPGHDTGAADRHVDELRVVGEGSRHGGPRGIGAGLAAQHEQVLGHGHRVKPMVSWPMLALMQPMQRHWAKASFWG